MGAESKQIEQSPEESVDSSSDSLDSGEQVQTIETNVLIDSML